MSEDVAYDLDVCPSIDLSTRMAVPKHMSPDWLGANTSETSIVLDSMANGTTGNWFVRHILSYEKVSDRSGRRPLPS